MPGNIAIRGLLPPDYEGETYLSANNNWCLHKPWRGAHERFTIEDLGDGMVAIKSEQFGKYLSPQSYDQNGGLHCVGHCRGWERLRLLPVGETNRHAIQSVQWGTYLSFSSNSQETRFNAKTIGKREQFLLEELPPGWTPTPRQNWVKMVLHPVLINHGVKGEYTDYIEIETGIIQNSFTSKEATHIAAEASGSVDVVNFSAQAEMSTSIESVFRSAFSSNHQKEMRKKNLRLDLSQPCYVYQGRVKMTLQDKILELGGDTTFTSNEELVETTYEV